MAYIYQADVWCDKCGEHIRAEITREGKAPEDIEDESSYDSDEFPKQYDATSEESDGPENCASGNCAGMYGTFLENQLTSEGYKYLKSMLDGHGKTLPDFAQEWADYYNFEYHDNPWKFPHDWLAEKSSDQYLLAIIDKLDADTIQDVFEKEMDEDGYFKKSDWYSDEMY